MARDIEVNPLAGRYKDGWSPHRVLTTVYKSYPELPIRGGWGYSKEDAVIIDRMHPAAANFHPFNGVEIEYIFVKLRMYEELIGMAPLGQQHSGCRYSTREQQLMDGEAGKLYDVLICDLTALPDDVFEELKAIWEGPDGFRSPSFDVEAHQHKHELATVHYVREYWFEISSFFGERTGNRDGGS